MVPVEFVEGVDGAEGSGAGAAFEIARVAFGGLGEDELLEELDVGEFVL
jgi:hypothetical protein